MHQTLADLREKMEQDNAIEDRKPRKVRVLLTELEKWEVAKYMIENKYVQLNKDGSLAKFRLFEKEITNEINELGLLNGKLIGSGYHLKDAMRFYHDVCLMTNNLPVVPVQDSVQEDILKVELQKVMQERDQLAKKVEGLEFCFAKAIINLEDTAVKMEQTYRDRVGAKSKKA